ncbi:MULTISPECIES: arsenosugar biosynthesis radical SAM (seleno)protein ArsS [Pseudomonadaceae]|jgi:radical SAM/Cys-rich protein|uniref:Fe-S oxidoreductase n=1 Tax=Stutzerimonas chloritidismutans AW-1 TaxID=1263865 RepID=V4QCS7_STUCH|nr:MULTISPECIES: arsenosugar biosynthesis radical SAM (seleno)protein ArsS [Pseudomonadaceae]MBJ7545881.1 arsenosugar biosynthesis radical SAM protein ArsS [Pseudomonas sp. OA3]ESQ97663.1 Fe-S oxidoreductase [Stutzerimonas chloritidismutans AW-1]MCL8047280.1 arsenosugar biosynthesis radical SAM protein ArsS [Pseudomonas aeruginosa]MCU9020119.1 arsenosugar biosynthesis radical SAM protein ArsS [Pseudomonas aeruginosa]MDI9738566.1 arsenosugar biosynthesis radical SAM protein ArsS [Stutzerimonas 
MHATLPLLNALSFPAITRGQLEALQVNLTYQCNQRCLHCHVNAGPTRKEAMTDESLVLLHQVIDAHSVQTLDLTGGAPEMHPRFREVVSHARREGLRVIDRCNLTILSEPGYEGLARFLAEQGVEVTASLPCYSRGNVDRQRGDGVFDASIEGLRLLNRLGYGQEGSGLILNLVYNPQGPSLPPPQAQLEADYTSHLAEDFGIVFNHLLTITNQPIARFGSTLVSKGTFSAYMQLLRDSYRPENLGVVMCRSLVSVDWQGYLYDCDFNQMLDLPMVMPGLIGRERAHLRDLLQAASLEGNPIMTRDHCYACTAGQGSSCGGALGE